MLLLHRQGGAGRTTDASSFHGFLNGMDSWWNVGENIELLGARMGLLLFYKNRTTGDVILQTRCSLQSDLSVS